MKFQLLLVLVSLTASEELLPELNNETTTFHPDSDLEITTLVTPDIVNEVQSGGITFESEESKMMSMDLTDTSMRKSRNELSDSGSSKQGGFLGELGILTSIVPSFFVPIVLILLAFNIVNLALNSITRADLTRQLEVGEEVLENINNFARPGAAKMDELIFSNELSEEEDEPTNDDKPTKSSSLTKRRKQKLKRKQSLIHKAGVDALNDIYETEVRPLMSKLTLLLISSSVRLLERITDESGSEVKVKAKSDLGESEE